MPQAHNAANADAVTGHCNAGVYFGRVEHVDRVEAFCHKADEDDLARGGDLTQRRRGTEGDLWLGLRPQTPKAIKSHAIDRHSGYGAEPHL